MKSDLDHRASFPNDAGLFVVDEGALYDGAVFCVEGPDLTTVGQIQPLSVSSTAQSSPTGTSSLQTSAQANQPPHFKSVIPKASKGQSHALRVVRAKMEWSRTGKVAFTTETQMYIDITEHTANVEYVMRDRWGDNYVLVTVDGLELHDSDGAKGKIRQNSSCFNDGNYIL